MARYDLAPTFNPWLALSSYEEKDSYRFKGRDDDIAKLLTMIEQNEVVTCYAASGEGKTSLINAGVCPIARINGLFPIRIVFTVDEFAQKEVEFAQEKVDFDTIIKKKIDGEINKHNIEFKQRNGDGVTDKDKSFQLVDGQAPLPSDLSNKLWWKLRTEEIVSAYTGRHYIPLLIFDQFEEIFRAKWKKEFFTWLEMLMRDVCPDDIAKGLAEKGISYDRLPQTKLFKALFSLRYEYIGELDYWCSQKSYIPLLMRNRYFLRPLTRKQAMEVLSNQSLDVDDDNASKALKKIKDGSEIITKKILGTMFEQGDGDEAPAIIVSLVAYVLFEECCKNPDCDINLLNYNDIIYNYYLSKLKELHISDRKRYVMEDELIDEDKTRLPVPGSDKKLKGIKKHIDSLVNEHILKVESIGGKEYVEFVHDRLALAIAEKRDRRKETTLRSKVFIAGVLALLVLAMFVGYRGLCMNGLKPWGDDRSSIFTESDRPDIHSLSTHCSDFTVYLGDGNLTELTIGGSRAVQLKLTKNNSCKRKSKLSAISVGKEVEELHLNFNGYKETDTIKGLTISLSEKTKILDLKGYSSQLDSLQFDIPTNNKYLLWRDSVLWDLTEKKAIYTNHKSSVRVNFPEGFEAPVMGLFYNWDVRLLPLVYDTCATWNMPVLAKEDAIKRWTKKVCISSIVDSIKEGAFAGLDSLEEVVFDSACHTVISPRAFADCGNLRKVTFARGCVLPDSPYWADNIFSECLNIEEIELVGEAKNENYTIKQGVVYQGDKPRLFTNKAKGVDLYYYVPEFPVIPKDSWWYKWDNGVFYSLIGDFVCVRRKNEILRLYRYPIYYGDSAETKIVGRCLPDVRSVEIHSMIPYRSPSDTTSNQTSIWAFEFCDNQQPLIRKLIVPFGAKDIFLQTGCYDSFKIEEAGLIRSVLWGEEVIMSNVFGRIKQDPLIGFLLMVGGLVLLFLVWWIVGKWVYSLGIFLLSLFVWFDVYWLCFLVLFPQDLVLSSIVATVLAVVAAGAGIWIKQSHNKMLFSSWKRLFTKGHIKGIKADFIEFWHKYKKAIAAIAALSVILGCGVHGYKVWRANNDLDKMVAEENWERVSKIVYDRLMACDSIDAMTYSWARSMLMAANENTELVPDTLQNAKLLDDSNSKVLIKDDENHTLTISDIISGSVSLRLDSVNDYGLSDDDLLVEFTSGGKTWSRIYDKKTLKVIVDSAGIQKEGLWVEGQRKEKDGGEVIAFNRITKQNFRVDFPEGYEDVRWLNGYLLFGADKVGAYEEWLLVNPNNTQDSIHFTGCLDLSWRFVYNYSEQDSVLTTCTCINGRIQTDTIRGVKHYYIQDGYIVYGNGSDVLIYSFANRRSEHVAEASLYRSLNDSTILLTRNASERSVYRIRDSHPFLLKSFVMDELPSGFTVLLEKGYYSVVHEDYVSVRRMSDDVECKRLSRSFSFNKCFDGFLAQESFGIGKMLLYPLDGSPESVSILLGTDGYKFVDCNTLVKDLDPGVGICRLPMVKTLVEQNRYLTARQKERLLEKLSH